MRRALVVLLAVILVGSFSRPAQAEAPDPRRWTLQADGDCSDHSADVRLVVNPAHGTDVPALATVYRNERWRDPEGWSYAGGLSYDAGGHLLGSQISFVTHHAQRLRGGAQTVMYQPPVAGSAAYCAVVIGRTGRTVVAVSHSVGVRIDVGRSPMLYAIMTDARRGQVYRLNVDVSTQRFQSRVVRLKVRAPRSGLVVWRLGTVPGLDQLWGVGIYSPRDHDEDGLELTRFRGPITLPSPQAYPAPPAPAPTPVPPTTPESAPPASAPTSPGAVATSDAWRDK